MEGGVVGSLEQALTLIAVVAAAPNRGGGDDVSGSLSEKLTSLQQLKQLLLSLQPSLLPELLPFLLQLHSQPEPRLRKSLILVMEEIGLHAMEDASMLIPVFITLLQDPDATVANQSIFSGTTLFSALLKEIAFQFRRHGRVDKPLQHLWTQMLNFKDAVFTIAFEPWPVGTNLLAVKFLETLVLLFSSDSNNSERSLAEGNGSTFNVSWLVDGHPVLDPVTLMSEANRTVGILLKLFHSARTLPGPLTINVVNWNYLSNLNSLGEFFNTLSLAAIARRRPLYYGTILSALLDFRANIYISKGCHAASVQYSLRTTFLGFLRCKYPTILESRDKLIRALREMNAGDAADQVIRQVDKQIKIAERSSRDARLGKDEQLPGQFHLPKDTIRKRSMLHDFEGESITRDLAPKRVRYDSSTDLVSEVENGDNGMENGSANGAPLTAPMLDSNSTPVEQMIAMIGALVGEGERGAESLEILISTIHPDLLADIVITNMKHLQKSPPPLTKLGHLPVSRQTAPSSSPEQSVTQITASNSPVLSTQMPIISLPDTSNSTDLPTDSKRDPRRDPRRMDPRRVADPVPLPPAPMDEEPSVVQSDSDGLISLRKPLPVPVVAIKLDVQASLEVNIGGYQINNDNNVSESSMVSTTDYLLPTEDVLNDVKDAAPIPLVGACLDPLLPLLPLDDEDSDESASTDNILDVADKPPVLLSNEHCPDISSSMYDGNSNEIASIPPYVNIAEEQQEFVLKSSVQRIIASYKKFGETGSCQTHMSLLARLVAQTKADDGMIMLLQKQIVSDYQNQKGHELVLHLLYQLNTVIVSEAAHSSSASATYEKILLAVAKSLLENLPATDKSFSRLLGEVPFLPESALKLIEDLCYSDVVDCIGKIVRESDRVTQGLGAVWSLILERAPYRQACLDIALKSAVHSQEEIRAKAIRLVANKLYQLSYLSKNVEQFATNMLLSVVDQHIPDIELSLSNPGNEKRVVQIVNQETSTSGSQNSVPGLSENDVQSAIHSVSTKSFPEAQCFISLFFALCTKKPGLLQLVFDIYGRAPKAVKQAVHRHIPVLVRALGTSNSELLHIISDPPQGSENLLSLVLQILTEETTPSPDLIATVKYLYETKLKDASILIPMLSSLSKSEVLPIFPRLVDLPLDKFQKALAHILQGSAHTGPALTPAEALVAIHDISPEKDGVPLKKITEVCSACFEQRMVFTHQVLAKALNEMVSRDHLPLLFMRTVIQTIDAFPKLVNCIMEILSKLVDKQVWKMPKLWVGFLKCISQTQPHSFHVMLQLPTPQLESALTKYARLRGPLTTYASQPSIRPSLARSTLVVLGLANESHIPQPHLTSLHQSDSTSSHGATLT